jgi:hypothetical protein
MDKSFILWIDAVINFLLGVLLLLVIPFPNLSQYFGVPEVHHGFYASIMGAVFIGIGIALLIEIKRETQKKLIGLGLGGAVAINLCGGTALVGWLLFGDLGIPIRGTILLWTLALLLVGVSVIELWMQRE